MTPAVPSPLAPRPARLAVLLSGRGSNFSALAAACERGEIPARIVLVLSDREGAQGLERAGRMGIRVAAVPRKGFAGREAHEEAVLAELEREEPDLVCLAGYMRLLSASFVASFPLRILNVHQAILPAFPGTEAQRQAVEYGVRVSGATVHFVDAGVDSGPIVGQEAVPVGEGDDAAALAERILPVEHRLYVDSVRKVLAGGWRLEGRRVIFHGKNPSLVGVRS